MPWLLYAVEPSALPPPSVGFLLWHLTVRWRAELERAIGAYGLTVAQYSVLATLYGLTRDAVGPRQREVAEFCGLEPMHVSKLVRVLEATGLIARAPHPADSRARQLRLT